MDKMEELKKVLCDELDEIAKKGKLTAGDLDTVDKLTHSIKSIETIMSMGGYSGENYGASYARGNRGGSYDNMSYRDGMGGGSYARRRDRRGRYSRGYSRDDMREELQELMEEAGTEQEREAIRRCIEQM